MPLDQPMQLVLHQPQLPLEVFDLAVQTTSELTNLQEPKGLDERTEEIILQIEQKHGSWYQSSKEANPLDPHEQEGNGVWRKAMTNLLKNALALHPVTLVATLPDSRWTACVVSGSQIVLLDKKLGVMHSYFENKQGSLNIEPSLPISCTENAFYWNRDYNPAVAWIDVQFEQSLLQLENGRSVFRQGSNDIRTFCVFTAKSATRKRKIINARGSVICGLELEFTHNISKASYALGAVAARITRSARFAFNAAVRRLLFKPAVNLARRFHRLDLYSWLIAQDSEIERQALVSNRRMQFALLYPELVTPLAIENNKISISSSFFSYHWMDCWGVQESVSVNKIEKLQELQKAVDQALPVARLVGLIRNWPSWIERSLRGKFIPANSLGVMNGFEDSFVRILAELGPAWRLRAGDAKMACVIALVCLALKIDIRQLRQQFKAVGSTSPWRQLYKQLPRKFREDISQSTKNGAHGMGDYIVGFIGDIQDCMNAFDSDVLFPLLGTVKEYNYMRQQSTNCLSSFGLFRLIKASDEWHQRIGVIERAKEAGRQESDAQIDLNEWKPLFYPFSWLDGKIEVHPLTSKQALKRNGSQMNHCVGSYANYCLRGSSHIIGFYRDSQAIATAQLNGVSGAQVQMRGPKNSNADIGAQAALNWISKQLELANGKENSCINLDLEENTESYRNKNNGVNREIGLLWTTPVQTILEEAEARTQLLEKIGDRKQQEYDWNDPEAVERVLVAWRFAMPEGLRTAWERGNGAQARVDNAKEWLLDWMSKQEKQEENEELPF